MRNFNIAETHFGFTLGSGNHMIKIFGARKSLKAEGLIKFLGIVVVSVVFQDQTFKTVFF